MTTTVVTERYEVWRHGEVRDRTGDLDDARTLVGIYEDTDDDEGNVTSDTYVWDTDNHCEVS